MNKKSILTLAISIAAAAAAFADGNVNVVNPSTRPVPVTQVVKAGASNLGPQYYSAHITTNTTTTVTSSTAYVESGQISVTGTPGTWTVTIRNKEGTPKILYQSAALSAVAMVPLYWDQPLVCTSGIDIVTSGTTPGVADVFLTYYQ
jgi:hypothetical protein